MIKDLLNKTKTSISFEVFPPKKEDEFQDVFSKLDALAVLKPDFMFKPMKYRNKTAKFQN